jgi:hypothetical protein
MTEGTVLKADESQRPDQVWPQTKSVRGGVYGFIDPAWGDHMVAMNMDTWHDVIADVKTMRGRIEQLEAEKAAAIAARDEKKIILVNPPGRIVQ